MAFYGGVNSFHPQNVGDIIIYVLDNISSPITNALLHPWIALEDGPELCHKVWTTGGFTTSKNGTSY